MQLNVVKSWMMLGLLVLVMQAPVSAQTTSRAIGVGGVVQNQGYTGGSNEIQWFPMANTQWGNLTIAGPNLSYEFLPDSALSLKAVAAYRFAGFDIDDSDFFIGMEERNGTVDLGLSLGLKGDLGEFEVRGVADVLNEYDGYEVSASYRYPIPVGRSIIAPRIAATYQSDDLVDYYFGVRQNEATAERAFYQGEATVNIEFGISGIWYLSQKQRFITALQYTLYGSDIEDSPLIEDSGATTLFLAYLYQF